MRVLVFGEILFDIIDGVSHLGGAPLNFSVHMAKAGADVRVISRIGSDELGAQVEDAFAAFSLATETLQRDSARPTGVADVFLTDEKVPDFTIRENAAWDHIAYDDAVGTVLAEEYDLFYFGTLATRGATTRETLHKVFDTLHAKHVFFDSNIRKNWYRPEDIDFGFERATILKLNEDEGALLTTLYDALPDMSDEKTWLTALRERFSLDIVCFTKGGAGASVCTRDEYVTRPCDPITLRDTTGAGDAFSGGFCRALLEGANVTDALESGSALAGFVASRDGALPYG